MSDPQNNGSPPHTGDPSPELGPGVHRLFELALPGEGPTVADRERVLRGVHAAIAIGSPGSGPDGSGSEPDGGGAPAPEGVGRGVGEATAAAGEGIRAALSEGPSGAVGGMDGGATAAASRAGTSGGLGAPVAGSGLGLGLSSSTGAAVLVGAAFLAGMLLWAGTSWETAPRATGSRGSAETEAAGPTRGGATAETRTRSGGGAAEGNGVARAKAATASPDPDFRSPDVPGSAPATAEPTTDASEHPQDRSPTARATKGSGPRSARTPPEAAAGRADDHVAGGDSDAPSLAPPAEPDADAAEPRAGDEAYQAEVDLLKRAQRAIAEGRPGDALGLLARYQARFPDGDLAVEHQSATIIALCAAGRVAEARRRAAAFLEHHGSHPHAARIRTTCPPE